MSHHECRLCHMAHLGKRTAENTGCLRYVFVCATTICNARFRPRSRSVLGGANINWLTTRQHMACTIFSQNASCKRILNKHKRKCEFDSGKIAFDERVEKQTTECNQNNDARQSIHPTDSVLTHIVPATKS